MPSTVFTHLRDDHARFERFFKAIEEECRRLESGGPADMTRLRAIVAYLGKYALPRHHAYEDAIFAQMAKHLPRFSLDILDLAADHHIGRLEFKSFKRAVEEGRADIAEAGRSYIAHERGHFIAEEEIFFQFAAAHVTEDQWHMLKEGKRLANGGSGPPDNLEAIADLLA